MKGGDQQKSLLADPTHVMHFRGWVKGSRRFEYGPFVVVRVVLVVCLVVGVRQVVVRCVIVLVSCSGVRVDVLVGLR